MPEWQAQGWVSTLHQVSQGELNIVSDTVHKLTGGQQSRSANSSASIGNRIPPSEWP
jgi:hypothetical protein